MVWATPPTWSDADSAAAVLARMNTAVRDVLAPPLMIDVDVFAEPKSQTNWSTLNVDVADARIYQCALESTGAQNAEIAWDVFIPAGTWRIDLVFHKFSNSGIYHVYFNGVQQTTIDGYGGGSNNQAGSATGIVVGSSASVELKLKMQTKNASSASYYGSISALRLRRTDTPASPKTWAAGVQKSGDLNTYVRDLACSPVLFDIDVFMPAASHTNFNTIAVDAGDTQVYAGELRSSGAQNAEISWDLIIPAGTWRVDLMHRTGNTNGIYSVQIDGVEKGTIDGYAGGGGVANVKSSVTGIAIATTDKHTLKLKMATKNASSGSYFGLINQVRLRRTDAPTVPKTWRIYDESSGALFNTHIRDNSAPAVLIDIDVYNEPAAQTNWSSLDQLDGSAIYQFYKHNAHNLNAEISWDVWLTAGTWRVDVMHVIAANTGIYSVQIDGVEQGTFDGYTAGATTPNTINSITGIAIATTKKYTLKLKITGKNASSVSYLGSLQRVRLRRTDI